MSDLAQLHHDSRRLHLAAGHVAEITSELAKSFEHLRHGFSGPAAGQLLHWWYSTRRSLVQLDATLHECGDRLLAKAAADAAKAEAPVSPPAAADPPPEDAYPTYEPEPEPETQPESQPEPTDDSFSSDTSDLTPEEF